MQIDQLMSSGMHMRRIQKVSSPDRLPNGAPRMHTKSRAVRENLPRKNPQSITNMLSPIKPIVDTV